MKWNNAVYNDQQLPFGLRSAPVIFNVVAEALEWILRERSVSHVLHYLDDFLVTRSPGSKDCAQLLDCMLNTCEELGIPLAR